MIQRWIGELHPKAQLVRGDGRLGDCYAIGMVRKDSSLSIFTDYMKLKELEKYIFALKNAESFFRKVKKYGEEN